MSRIKELIRDLCPDGVEFKELGEILHLNFGARITKSKDTGTIYPVYGGGGESFRTDAYNREDEWVISRFAMSENCVRWVEGRFWMLDSGFTFDVAIPDLDKDYVGQALLNMQPTIFATSTQAAQKNIDIKGFKHLRIPVPPFEVQREIVLLLDHFSPLEAELEEELEAELEARKRQYVFCWNALLTPGDGWRSATLGKIADVFDGPHATPKKTDSGPWYLSISSLKNGRFDLTQSAHIGVDQYDTWIRRVAPRVGDTMFSYETRLGQAAYWDRDEPAALGRRMGLLRPRESEVYPRFLTLAYLGPEFQSLIRAKTVRGATVDRIPIADVPNWAISIPPIPEQQRIVGILNNVGPAVSDLSANLCAELNARRKQYEHYRDQLLTFKELAA